MSEPVPIDRERSSRPVAAGARRNTAERAGQTTFVFAARHPDAEAREQALRACTSFVVEAPAGSGKTGLLIQRYLTLLASDDVESPEQVMAITFTRAAAHEIRERLLEALDDAGGNTSPASADDDFAAKTRAIAAKVLTRDRERDWKLRDHPERLRVRTIDGVCSEIVGLLPVMSGGGATLQPTEQPRALYARAARRTVLHMGQHDAALSAALEVLLLHRGANIASCVDLIAEMLAVREQWGGFLPQDISRLTDSMLESTTRPAMDRALEAAICAELREIETAIPALFLQQISAAAAGMSDRPGHNGMPSPLLCCESCPEAPQALAEHLQRWRALASLVLTGGGGWRQQLSSNMLGFHATASDKTELKALLQSMSQDETAKAALGRVGSLPNPQYDERQWSVLKALFRVLAQAQVELKLLFGETGQCDFAELALLARVALGDGARAYDMAAGLELRHLLVDEMQDTSTGQYALLETLTRGWAGDGRTLFLVGDPKQSIYLFRQARVERFVQTMRDARLGDVNLAPLQLSTNFRSQPALVAAANANFSRIFTAPAGPSDEIGYTSAAAVRSASGSTSAGETWHPAVITNALGLRRQAKQRSVRRHAEEMRRIILEWRARPLPPERTEPWRIAVLVASRQELKPVVAALRRAGDGGPIPFRARDVEHLVEQPEVLDLLALTRALRHPADRVAWLSILRAPWCGLSLADLHQLAGGDDHGLGKQIIPVLMQQREQCLSPDGQARLRAVQPVLEAAQERSGRVHFPELVETTWGALGADRFLDETALRNAAQFFTLLHVVSGQQDDDLVRALELRMDRLYAAAGVEEDAVELTTIHGAKGLEWDVVLIPELDRRAPNVIGRLLEWEEVRPTDEATAGVVFAPVREHHGDDLPLSKWLRGKRAHRLEAERKRLFYVACTRAREALHLFATALEHKDHSISAPERSLLEAAWPAAEERFAGLRATSSVAASRESQTKPSSTGSSDVSVLQLAASADGEGAALDEQSLNGDGREATMLSRLSLGSLHRFQSERARISVLDEPQANEDFARPQGSFLARSLGNCVHAFLEQAAIRIAHGQAPAELLGELPQWRGRIKTLLRNDGLSRRDVKRLRMAVETALTHTLSSPIGQWILQAQQDARSEYALTLRGEAASQVRLDRIFRAGPLPESEGDSHLWIVDFKTGSRKGEGLDAWLEAEKAKYSRQMKAYADVFPSEDVRLALWYPMLAKLVWWSR